MRNLGKLRTFCTLCFDEVLEKLLREYTACGKVVVICLKSIESSLKRSGKTLELCLFLLGKM